jgi:hypothetical protein
MERGSRRRFRSHSNPQLSRRRVVMPHRPWSWRPRAVALLVSLLLTTWVLPGSALAATPARDLRSEGSESPASIESVRSCRAEVYEAGSSNQEALIEVCVERLPGGVRAHLFLSVHYWGTGNFKGTLHTCSYEFGCRKSRDFWFQGVGSAGVQVATAWDSSCPTTANWYGYIRLLDIRFMPSGELHRGTGPYYSWPYLTDAC